MNFSQEERAGKAGHNGFRVMNPPGGKSNWSPYTQFQETPSLRDNRPTNFSQQGQQQLNSYQINQQLEYQKSRLGEAGIPHPRSVALSARDDFMNGPGRGGQPANQISAMGAGQGPMNPKAEYNGMMEKRQGSGRSYGGGSSHFNPFAHDGQGQYDDPYRKKENENKK